ncbi:hypothetical protein MICA_565 [Micavibrio aeruginosavorus ARL-13]|uniref:Uncharacterized protein n=2 Tax=Micavibrio aeruginosavorus TaxID=349221 RepID=G2KMX0_MICAA|nr:hypothetical protein MICA_565 [Micavibrio aeruginosavorus ARL-13]
MNAAKSTFYTCNDENESGAVSINTRFEIADLGNCEVKDLTFSLSLNVEDLRRMVCIADNEGHHTAEVLVTYSPSGGEVDEMSRYILTRISSGKVKFD